VDAGIYGVTPVIINYICKSFVKSYCKKLDYFLKSTYLKSFNFTLKSFDKVFHISTIQTFFSLFFRGIRSVIFHYNLLFTTRTFIRMLVLSLIFFLVVILLLQFFFFTHCIVYSRRPLYLR
jgi:hypothetical protein